MARFIVVSRESNSATFSRYGEDDRDEAIQLANRLAWGGVKGEAYASVRDSQIVDGDDEIHEARG